MAVPRQTRLRRGTIALLWCVAAVLATLSAAMQFSGCAPRRLTIPSTHSRVAMRARGGDGEQTQGALNTYELMGIKVKLPDFPNPEVEVDPEVEASVKKTGTNIGQGLAAGGAAAAFAAIAIANPVVGAAGAGAAALAAIATNMPQAEEAPAGKSGSKSKSEEGSLIDEKSLWDVGKAFGGFFIGGIIAFILAAVFGFSIQIPFLAGGVFGAIAAGGAAWVAVGTPLPDGVSYDEKDGLKLPEIKSGMEIGGFKLPELPDMPFQDKPAEVKKVEEEEAFNPFSWLPGSDSKDSKDK